MIRNDDITVNFACFVFTGEYILTIKVNEIVAEKFQKETKVLHISLQRIIESFKCGLPDFLNLDGGDGWVTWYF